MTMVASFFPERERYAGAAQQRQAGRGRRGWVSGALVAVLVLGCALDGAGALRAKRDAEGGGEVSLSRPLALSQDVWAHHFGEPGLFSAPKLTDVYRTPSFSTPTSSYLQPLKKVMNYQLRTVRPRQ